MGSRIWYFEGMTLARTRDAECLIRLCSPYFWYDENGRLDVRYRQKDFAYYFPDKLRMAMRNRRQKIVEELRSLGFAIRITPNGSVWLDVSHLKTAMREKWKLVLILDEETERARDCRRHLKTLYSRPANPHLVADALSKIKSFN